MKQLVFMVSIVLCCVLLSPTVSAANFTLSSQPDLHEALEGEWYFYHEQLLQADAIYQRLATGDTGQIVTIPSSFEQQVGQVNTYGTFATVVTVPQAYVGKTMSIHIPFQYSAYRLFIEDTFIAENGIVGTTAETHVTEMAPRIATFSVSQQQLLVVLQLSSFEHIRGGFNNPIYIGSNEEIMENYNNELFVQMLLIGGNLVIGLFIFIFSSLNHKIREYIWFSLFCMILAIRSMFSVPFLYTITSLNMSWEWGTRIEYITTILATMIYIQLIATWYKGYYIPWILRAEQLMLTGLLLITCVTSPMIFQDLFFKLYIFVFLSIFYILYMSIKSLKNQPSATIVGNMIGCVIVALAVGIEYIAGQLAVNYLPMSLFGFTVYIFIQACIFGHNYIKATTKTEQLNDQLVQLNQSLDEQVAHRTEELQRANQQLHQQAISDGLTGIHNRMSFNRYMEQQFAAVQAEQISSLSLLLLDLDEFKKYNDYYGHTAGDQLLIDVVQSIQQVLRKDVFFARYGGEEFAIVCPNMKADELQHLGELVRQTVAQQQFVHAASRYQYVTVSLGGATMYKGDYAMITALIDEADAKLYHSKHQGRNQFSN